MLACSDSCSYGGGICAFLVSDFEVGGGWEDQDCRKLALLQKLICFSFLFSLKHLLLSDLIFLLFSPLQLKWIEKINSSFFGCHFALVTDVEMVISGKIAIFVSLPIKGCLVKPEGCK